MTNALSPLKTLLPLLLLSLCVICPRWVAACDQVPAGQTFQIRLLQPLSSYSTKEDTRVTGILIESPQCDGAPIFPIGTAIEGQIRSVRKVGLGFRHETAELDIEFVRIVPNDAPPMDIRTRVLEVDNAREKVIGGVIHGIRRSEER